MSTTPDLPLAGRALQGMQELLDAEREKVAALQEALQRLLADAGCMCQRLGTPHRTGCAVGQAEAALAIKSERE